MGTAFAQYVSRVLLPLDVVEVEDAGGDRSSDAMVVGSRAALVQHRRGSSGGASGLGLEVCIAYLIGSPYV